MWAARELTWPTAYRMSGANGAADQVPDVIAVVDLGQAAVHLNVLAAEAGGHVAEGQRVGQLLGRGELAGQANLSIGYLSGLRSSS